MQNKIAIATASSGIAGTLLRKGTTAHRLGGKIWLEIVWLLRSNQPKPQTPNPKPQTPNPLLQ